MADIFFSAHANATQSEHAVLSWPPVFALPHCVVRHRLEVVPVGGEAPIVIAVSPPHRKEVFVGCEYLLEKVKPKTPIWKKGVHESGELRAFDLEAIPSGN